MMRAVVATGCIASAGVAASYPHISATGDPVYTVPARAPDAVPARTPDPAPARTPDPAPARAPDPAPARTSDPAPARAPEPPPAPSPSSSTTTARPIDPTDHAALARALQRELKRVGCYQGGITEVWTTSSRLAMKTFNERVNATLPIDNPDPVLLRLVEGYQERACTAACPPGQAAAKGDACLPATVAAKAGDAPTAAGRTAAAVTVATPDRV